MLRLEGASAAYGAVHALEGVSLAVRQGQIVCLLGANGAGKTTLLNCVSGVVPLRSGSIYFEGERIDGLDAAEIVKRGLVQVPEGREVFPVLNVVDNLMMGAWVHRGKGTQVRADLDRVYAVFPRLAERSKQLAGTLSGGEQQMLMIGRALMSRPRLLLFDEPSLGLAPRLVEQLFDTIKQLHAQGLTALIVEQNARLALSTSDYGYILENGELFLYGPAEELLHDPRVHEAYLGT
jgi:branched-chain amino acid transport system ATP-binding protein